MPPLEKATFSFSTSGNPLSHLGASLCEDEECLWETLLLSRAELNGAKVNHRIYVSYEGASSGDGTGFRIQSHRNISTSSIAASPFYNKNPLTVLIPKTQPCWDRPLKHSVLPKSQTLGNNVFLHKCILKKYFSASFQVRCYE